MPITKQEESEAKQILPCMYGHIRRMTNSGRIYCPECNNKHNTNNKENIAAYKQKWRQENRERIRGYWHTTYKNDPIKKQKKIEWTQRNKESISLKKKDYKRKLHPLFGIWANINQRCHGSNKTGSSYSKYYSGKGVSIYEPWRIIKGNRSKETQQKNAQRFREFVNYVEAYLGERKESESIDRYPNYQGNYEPGNIRWATPKQQANNRGVSPCNRIRVDENTIVQNGSQRLSLKDISILTGIHISVVKDRYAVYGNFRSITNDRKLIQRKYLYKDNLYSLVELSLISGLSYTTLKARLLRCGWSVVASVETPLYNKITPQ